MSLTLPGSASLGAFQAGAVSALSVVLRRLRDHDVGVAIDAVGGASAGSIVGLLAAHGLLTGRDVPSLLCDAWVDQVDVGVLRRRGPDAPLSLDRLRTELVAFLDDGDHPHRVHEPLASPICLQVGLTSLLGFTVQALATDGDSSTLSYVDWAEFDLRPGHDIDALVEPRGASALDAVLASAAHPAAFAPRSLDRSDDGELYRRRGISNVELDEPLWYTDGALVQSRPVGRVLAAARANAGSAPGRRIHLVVDPRSSGPTSTEQWHGDDDHSWIDGLRRAMSVVPTQALHDDLRGVADVNDRLARLDELVAELTAGRDDGDELAERLSVAAGLAGKEHVDIEIVSPLERRGRDGEGVGDLLAGDFVGAFGGFLERQIRRSDYALGWACTADWMPGALARHDVSDETIAALGDDLREAEPEWTGDVELSGDGVDQLDARGRWRLALLAGQFGRALWHAAVPSPTSLVPWPGDGG